MVVYVGVLGPSGSGKTRVIESLTKALVRKGIRVGAVKHSSHAVFDLKGKDTRRLREAGAYVVVGIFAEEVMVVRELRRPMGRLEEIRQVIGDDVDVIFIEGYYSLLQRHDSILKIVVVSDPRELHRFLPDLKGRIVVLAENESRFAVNGVVVNRTDMDKLFEIVEAEVSRA